jgi:uncharacterized protein DUF2735
MSVLLRVLETLEGKAMTEQPERPTATIYQFPVKARTTRREGIARKASDVATRPVEFGSGWYHDAAIQEAEQAHR